jgi:ATP-binding protein involved in chromosome partitioning
LKKHSEIAGDGGSRIAEQVADQRERIAHALSRVRRRVAVASGKGGVGKSTLTLELATAFVQRGLAVAVLDADLNGPSQARLAGLGAAPLLPGPDGLVMPRTKAGLGVVSLGSLVPAGEAVEFQAVAHGDSHVWRATREFSFLGQLLGSVDWGRLDWLLVDLPPGAERTFQYAEFLGPETALVLVTLPTELSHEVVSRSARALAGTPNRVLGWIENMSGYCCPGCGQVQPLFPSSGLAGFGVPCLGRVPFDPGLAALSAGGASRAPEGGAREAIRETAQALELAFGEGL